ncbi:hypothetical protein MKW94_026729 [Papaver nudicaule]|uniref:Glycine-rich protein n=1 Tax=Papaver nudicaule TaxID=74823 RepID=A0AA41V5Y6_PAPNU|nr:hypothetical protein [Papaver nudicaule]
MGTGNNDRVFIMLGLLFAGVTLISSEISAAKNIAGKTILISMVSNGGYQGGGGYPGNEGGYQGGGRLNGDGYGRCHGGGRSGYRRVGGRSGYKRGGWYNRRGGGGRGGVVV